MEKTKKNQKIMKDKDERGFEVAAEAEKWRIERDCV